MNGDRRLTAGRGRCRRGRKRPWAVEQKARGHDRARGGQPCPHGPQRSVEDEHDGVSFVDRLVLAPHAG